MLIIKDFIGVGPPYRVGNARRQRFIASFSPWPPGKPHQEQTAEKQKWKDDGQELSDPDEQVVDDVLPASFHGRFQDPGEVLE